MLWTAVGGTYLAVGRIVVRLVDGSRETSLTPSGRWYLSTDLGGNHAIVITEKNPGTARLSKTIRNKC